MRTYVVEALQAVTTLLWFLSIPAVIVSWTTKLGMARLGSLPPLVLLAANHPWCCLAACILASNMMYELFWDRTSHSWFQSRYQDAPMRTLHILSYTTMLVLVDVLAALGAYKVMCNGEHCTLSEVLTMLYRIQPILVLGSVLLYGRWQTSVTSVLVEVGILLPVKSKSY